MQNSQISHSWSGRATQWEWKGRLMFGLLLYVRTKIEGKNMSKNSWISNHTELHHFCNTIITTEFRVGKHSIISTCNCSLRSPIAAQHNIVWLWSGWVGCCKTVRLLRNNRRFRFHLGGGFSRLSKWLSLSQRCCEWQQQSFLCTGQELITACVSTSPKEII